MSMYVCVCMHAHVNDYISIEKTMEGNMLVHSHRWGAITGGGEMRREMRCQAKKRKQKQHILDFTQNYLCRCIKKLNISKRQKTNNNFVVIL